MSQAGDQHPTDRLSAFLDGELDASTRGEVARHVASCDACRALLADLDAVSRAVRDERAPSPPDGLGASVRAALDRDGASGSFAGRLARRVPLAAAASVLLVVAIALIMRADLGGMLGPLDRVPAEPAGRGAADSTPAAPLEQEKEAAKQAAPDEESFAREPGGATGPVPRPPDAPSVARVEPRERVEADRPTGQRAREEAFADDAAADSAVAEARRGDDATMAAEGRLAGAAPEAAPGRAGALSSARESADRPREGGDGRPAARYAPDPSAPEQERRDRERSAAKSAVADARPPVCTATGELPSVGSLAWTESGPGGGERFARAAAAADLGLVITRDERADPSRVVVLVPVDRWPAFRAWVAERQPGAAPLPLTATDRRPPESDCVRLPVQIVPGAEPVE